MATITRSALYALVWADPVTTVAARLGLKGWKLTEVCGRHHIPVPPSGWWTRKRLGKPVEQTPLPPGDDTAIPLPSPVPPAEADTGPLLVVPDVVRRYHPLVAQTQQVLKTLKPGGIYHRPLLIPHEKSLHVAVSPAQLTRALRIMDTLVRALDSRGYQPRLPSEGVGLEVTVDGQTLLVALDERCKQVKPPAAESAWRKFRLAPSRILTLQVRQGTWVRAQLVESPSKPLEQQLNAFVATLQRHAAQRKAEAEAHARREREWEEQARLRRDEAARIEAERKREEQWDGWMANWKKAQDVRAFARALREICGPQQQRETAEWLEWARAYAERLDPLTGKG